MAKTPRRKKRPDPAQAGFDILQGLIEATGDVPDEPELEPDKNPHAVALSKLGSKKGGEARAAKLGKKKLSELGKKMAAARWNKPKTAKRS